MQYYCSEYVGTSSCYLDMLDGLWKGLFKIVGPTPEAFLEPLAHFQDVVILNH